MTLSMKRIKLLWILLACSMLVVSCRFFRDKPNPKARYGKEYNSVRDSLGIPPIHKWWKTLDCDSCYSVYGTRAVIPPCRYKKTVFYESGQIEFEIDEYTAGEQYKDGALDRHRKNLHAYYFYVEPLSLIRNNIDSLCRMKEYEMFKKGINYAYDFGDGIEDYKVITKEQADSIMNSWGITYND